MSTVKQYSSQYYAKNREAALAKQKERDGKRDPEQMREYRRKYYQANRERILEQQRIRSRENYLKNPERYAERNRRTRLKSYGLTEAEYMEMLASQSGRCAICGTTNGRRKSETHPLYVDHDHSTGAVRGLLCQPCNSALGMLEDDPERLRRAVEYLTRSSSGAISTASSEPSSKPSEN